MRNFIQTLSALACAVSASAIGAVVEYTVDSSASFMTVSGTFAGVPISAQTPGSLTAQYIGSFRGDLTSGLLSLQDHSIRSLLQADPQFPIPVSGGTGAASFGFRGEAPTGREAFFTINTLGLYLSTDFGPPLDVLDGNFAPGEVGFFMDGGTLSHSLTGMPTGSLDLHGIGGGNRSLEAGALTVSGGVETLTIPIVSSTVVLDVLSPGDLNLTFSGRIVATRVVPEPATTLLLLAGMGILCWRRSGRAGGGAFQFLVSWRTI